MLTIQTWRFKFRPPMERCGSGGIPQLLIKPQRRHGLFLPATLGYEWDQEEDNGSRPAGLIDLSTSTYTLTTDYLEDYGGIYGAGIATHRMSLYRAPSGALVFGAGTVQWSWGLDGNHDGDGPRS